MFMAAHSATIRIVILSLLLIAPAAIAQAPSEEWRTLKTAHFRFHYPVEYEAWAQRAASRIESVREAVVREVGFAPETVTDVLIMNPVAEANGVMIPILRYPRMMLFTEPPEPELVVGEFSSWIDLLTVHETAHMVHLLRPSRNPMQHLIERIIPINPITRRAPRWVMEGYATVVEGRLTGSGRPSSSMRAAILRKWALSGRLPTYDQLDSDRRFLGMSMAYLMGSAFLEWLDQDGTKLRNLWARLTARQKRSFDGAFEGVFGDKPERMYGRFVAELTARAKAVERAEAGSLREGELWQELERNSGEPAVSPDGKKIAWVARNDRGEAKLVVYSTGENEEEKKWREDIEKMIKRDPEDVAPVRTKPLPRKPLHTLKLTDRGDIGSPRWLRDGSAILYSHRQPDRDGFLHHDLFVWNFESGETRRVTHLADVQDADPLPDGKSAVAVRNRFGHSQLVNVDLASGQVTERTPPSLERIYAHPRANADGKVVWAEHDESGWRVQGVGAFDPEWGQDGELYATVSRRGFLEVMRIDGGGHRLVTRTLGGAGQAAPSPDGSLFFMSLEPDGFVVRRLADPSLVEPTRTTDVTLVPALPPDPPLPVVFKAESLSAPHRYGIGRQERSWFFGGRWTAYDKTNEIGLRLGDIVGRLDTIGVYATGGDAAIASTWRGLPVALTAHAYKLHDNRGVEVRGEYEHRAPLYAASIVAGRGEDVFAMGALALRQRKTSQTFRFAADADDHARGALTLSFDPDPDFSIRVTGEAGRNIAIGGYASTAVPDSLLIGRVLDPALPEGFAFDRNYRSLRADLSFAAFNVFWRRYDDLDVRGLEVTFDLPPMPIVRSAGMQLTAGAAKVSELRGTKGWLAIRWRP